MDTKAVSIGLILAGAALDGSAVTLGAAQGAAWIGQPLALNFPVTLDAGVDSGPLCPAADVFYADSLQEPGRIQIQSEPGATPDTLRLRLTSSAQVDEPVVRVVVRVGCQQKVSRSYVMLADLPIGNPASERAALATAPAVPLVTPPVEEASTVPAPTTAPLPAPPRSNTSPTVADDAPAAAATAPATPRARTPNRHVGNRMHAPVRTAAKTQAPTATSEPHTAPAAAGSRLKLDPLEILVERVKTLESTTAAVPLEDLAKDAGRVQQLQNDMQALLLQAEKNEVALQSMRERLEKAESDRLTTLLSFGLAALALLCAVVIAVVWSRRREPAWRQDPGQQRDPPRRSCSWSRRRQPPPPRPLHARPWTWIWWKWMNGIGQKPGGRPCRGVSAYVAP